MSSQLYRYAFAEAVPLEEVEATVVLALFGVESLFGESQTRLDARHFLDAQKRACVIDAGTAVGRAFNKLFTGFLAREFGPGAFRVERLSAPGLQPAGAC